MAWLQRLFGEESRNPVEARRNSSIQDPRTGPGLTGQYDWELREKAGVHEPPLQPEQLGLEGEFDEQGLAKRVAAAFDGIPALEAIETVTLRQDGNAIILEGSVPDQKTLENLVAIASQVDGTKLVDAHSLVITAS